MAENKDDGQIVNPTDTPFETTINEIIPTEASKSIDLNQETQNMEVHIAKARGRLMSTNNSRITPINHDSRTPRFARGTSFSDQPSGGEEASSESEV